jgi:ABC transporter substrate binding protein (PQQ-dependent alcohol dehydrogenase system)
MGRKQLQNRFVAMFSRPMTERDWKAWAAARMIGEAAARTSAPRDPKAMLAFFKSPDFSLAAFKGQRLTLRDWNLQLRQPILLADGRVVVSVSPQEGLPASGLRARYARLRPARNQVQAEMSMIAALRAFGFALPALSGCVPAAPISPMSRTRRATPYR